MSDAIYNRLADQTSPYLLQHAHNPVAWWPWCDEAFAQAVARDVPVFLSIGYAACHWCHVMERESFSDPAVARLMNQRFVCIKVDREERPAVDALYMDALIAMGQPAGWPASLWLDHDRLPFYGGTYFPPYFRYGTPAFSQILRTMDESWRGGRAGLAATAARLRADLAVAPPEPLADPRDAPGDALLPRCLEALSEAWDSESAGWGQGAKFPMPPNLELLLDQGLSRGDARCLEMARAGLEAMDRGGIHDHLGGGFHRYTVDPEWEVPHFEKMLYDNAQLLRLYAQAAASLREPRWAAVASGIAGWLMREMRHGSGAFYASQDADSEGEEGIYYTWTLRELRALLPAAQAERFAAAYGVTEWGNHEGRSVLSWKTDDPTSPALSGARARLLKARRQRVAPATDTKLVVGWNGLAVSALARAGRLLGRRAWVMAAEDAARAVLAARQRRNGGRDGASGGLPRTLADGSPAGTCKDHAYLAEGLLDLHEATLDGRWLEEAAAVSRIMIARFYDPSSGVFHRADDPGLPVRRADLRDGAEPSGTGRALEVMRRLAAYGFEDPPAALRRQALATAAALAGEEPAGHAEIAAAVDRDADTTEVILSGPAREDLLPLKAVFDARWRPRAVLGAITETSPAALSALSAFRGRGPGRGPRAFVCRHSACSLPTADPQVLRGLVDKAE